MFNRAIRTNMTLYTAHGISAYVDGVCWSVKIPGLEGGETEIALFSDANRGMRAAEMIPRLAEILRLR